MRAVTSFFFQVFLGNSPDQLACIKSNSIRVLEIGDMENLRSLDPVIFYSMSKLVSLKVRLLVTFKPEVRDSMARLSG